MKLFSKYRTLLLFLLLTFICMLELNLIQVVTISSKSFSFSTVFSTLGSRRSFLDFFAFGAAVALLPSPLLYLLFVLNIPFYLTLMTYYEHFFKPIGWLTLSTQGKEALSIFKFDLAWFNPHFLTFVLVAFALKLTLYRFLTKTWKRYPKRIPIGYANLACYGLLFSILTFLFPLKINGIYTICDVHDIGKRYGYLPVWTFAFFSHDQKDCLAEAIEQSKITSTKLAQEPPLDLPNKIVIIQAESLDYDILDFVYNGKQITPFLNTLKDQSILYKIEAIHINGSADADFILLNRVMPCSAMLNYKILKFPYKNTTPEIAKAQGYAFHVLHGNVGHFFNRHYAFEKMGITECIFQEQLMKNFNCHNSKLAVKDHEVFRVSNTLLNNNPHKDVHFIITLTSHVPFTLLDDDDPKIIQNPQGSHEHYLNSIHYVDLALSEYIPNLPEDTLVLIYGDHESQERKHYKPESPCDNHKEFVPFIIYQKGKNLAQHQRTRNTPMASSGQLNFLDMANYIAQQWDPKNPKHLTP